MRHERGDQAGEIGATEPPSAGDDELTAAHAAARLAKVAEVRVEQVDLSLPQYRLMLLLGEGSSVATALAERLTVTRPSVTALVDGLVERGLVERRPDPGDRRRITHALTPDGRAALEKADAVLREGLTELASNLAADEARAAIRGLSLWIKALDIARARRAAAGSAGSS
jgi:long-chain acyl-CoA synthetase